MTSRLMVASTVAATAALALAVLPAQAAPTSTTTESDSFSSTSGLDARSTAAPGDLPALPNTRAARSSAAAAVPELDLTREYIRGYQTLYAPGYANFVLGDVDVAGGEYGTDYCQILTNMNINGSDRDEPAQTYPGAYLPNDDLSGGTVVPSTYGAASYRFGPHFFYGSGTDGECFTDDDFDDYLGIADETVSNTVRIRYASKGSVQYSKKGSKVKVHVLSQRFDRTGKYVGQRSIKLQYRKPGTTTWKTKKTMSLDVTGRGDYYFTSSSRNYYRVYVPQTDNVQGAISSQSII